MAESRVNFQRRPSNMTPDGYQLQFSDDYGQNEAMISTGELAKPTLVKSRHLSAALLTSNGTAPYLWVIEHR